MHIAAQLIECASCVYREVPEKDAKDYADSIHAIFVETSAKNAININEVFIEISECVPSVFDAADFYTLQAAHFSYDKFGILHH